MPAAKKLIEVALPLDAIKTASVREKSIRHGHPSTLHLWWARRPLAAARAVIFTSPVEIPPRFAGMPPVNPRDRAQIGRETWKGAAGLAADLRYYGEWVRETGYDARETGYDARETGRVVLQQG